MTLTGHIIITGWGVSDENDINNIIIIIITTVVRGCRRGNPTGGGVGGGYGKRDKRDRCGGGGGGGTRTHAGHGVRRCINVVIRRTGILNNITIIILIHTVDDGRLRTSCEMCTRTRAKVYTYMHTQTHTDTHTHTRAHDAKRSALEE